MTWVVLFLPALAGDARGMRLPAASR
jgi:hypothetical protein